MISLHKFLSSFQYYKLSLKFLKLPIYIETNTRKMWTLGYSNIALYLSVYWKQKKLLIIY